MNFSRWGTESQRGPGAGSRLHGYVSSRAEYGNKGLCLATLSSAHTASFSHQSGDWQAFQCFRNGSGYVSTAPREKEAHNSLRKEMNVKGTIVNLRVRKVCDLPVPYLHDGTILLSCVCEQAFSIYHAMPLPNGWIRGERDSSGSTDGVLLSPSFLINLWPDEYPTNQSPPAEIQNTARASQNETLSRTEYKSILAKINS